MKVLVLGGYGNFGAIIAETLAREASFEVVVAGRDGARAREFAARIGATGARIDTGDANFAASVRTLQPALIIATAGPFQGQDYRVARAALACAAHYFDIADARAFVCGIGALDAQARAAGRLVVSGASSVPGLSSAVVERLAAQFASMETIDIGISASQKTPGLATVGSVLSYCGKPFSRWREAEWTVVHGWQHARRHAFTHARLRRWLAECDVSDLQLLPEKHGSLRDVRFSAGVELAAVQWGLGALAWMVRARWLKSAAAHARPLAAASRFLEKFGSGRSAMFLRVAGRGRDGQPLERTWELHAREGAGIRVPCMAVVALARKLDRGELPPAGAMPCIGLLTLEEYLAELDGGLITTHGADGARGPAELAGQLPFPL